LPITSLKQADIKANLDKAPVEILSFQSAATPLSLFLVLDISGAENFSDVQRSLIEMVKRLPSGSEVSVLSSNLGHEDSYPFSKDPEVIANHIRSYKPEGRSTFFISVLPLARATSKFLQKSNQRAIAIYLTTTDSFFDDDSIKKEAEVIRQGLADASAAVPIFGIYLGEEKTDQAKRSAAQHILEGTGGKCYFSKSAHELQGILDQIFSISSGLYSAGLEVGPVLNDGRIHQVEVYLDQPASKRFSTRGGKLSGNFYSPAMLTKPALNPAPATTDVK
jgi:hypothetical protein